MNGLRLIVSATHDPDSEVTLCMSTEFITVRLQSFVTTSLSQLADGLSFFSNGAIPAKFDFVFGEFGPNSAGGAAHLHFDYVKAGEIVVTIDAESEYRSLGSQKFADRALLTFRTQPVLLDNFMDELAELILKKINIITLERF